MLENTQPTTAPPPPKKKKKLEIYHADVYCRLGKMRSHDVEEAISTAKTPRVRQPCGASVSSPERGGVERGWGGAYLNTLIMKVDTQAHKARKRKAASALWRSQIGAMAEDSYARPPSAFPNQPETKKTHKHNKRAYWAVGGTYQGAAMQTYIKDGIERQ